ncbi:MAG: SUMF1/EgtB/PvdO family nonheme iron enzyme [Anaerolineae bacterium]|nr:SUMF1/EgtB/PvdO family nonheme iron enzyme [Anaerolineae bacterium]
MPRIFISYRRSDSQTITGRINDRLVQTFGGRNVFKDVDDIPPGVDFRQVIRSALSQKVTALIIIGPGWLDARDQHGSRRLDDPNDFVRIEVRTALERSDARVVPVLVDGAEMPPADLLPEDVRPLAYRNAVVIRQDPDFHRDVQRLIHQIQDGSVLSPARTRWMIAAVVLIALLALAALYAIQRGVYIATLPPGTRSASLSSETPNNLTRAVENLTLTAVQELTEKAPSPTRTPDEVQTLMAQIRASETAKVAESMAVAATEPPTATMTSTLDTTATSQARRTQVADEAAFALTSTAEELTQRQQQRANTPTITSLPSRTATATLTATASPTLTPTVTHTVTPDLTATAEAARLNETRIYQAALATQTSGRATAEAANVIAYYTQPDGLSLNVRAEPGGNVVATIMAGDSVVVVGTSDDGQWSEVRLNGDVTGWSASNLLTMIGTPTPVPDPTEVWNLAQQGVSRNSSWTPFIQDFDGVMMALVPNGCLNMGSDLVADEAPRSRQCVEQPFWIDVQEVSNGQFAALEGVAGRASDTPGDDDPRNRISWTEARAFCEARGGRLPTELEWEYAARGPSNFTHAWGGQLDILLTPLRLLNFCDQNCDREWHYTDYDDEYAQAAPVNAYRAGASWVGAVNLNGNLWEWVSTAYDTVAGDKHYPYPYDASDGREDLDVDNVLRVVRGGSWVSTLAETRSSNRDRYAPTNRVLDVGFRCAREVEQNP